MKKLGILLFCIIVIGLCFSSCDNDSGTKTKNYYYELLTIKKSDYSGYTGPNTFEGIKSYYNSLKVKMYTFEGKGNDLSSDDVTNLLTRGGMSKSQANSVISATNSVGNNVLVFEHATDYSLYAILYIEK